MSHDPNDVQLRFAFVDGLGSSAEARPKAQRPRPRRDEDAQLELPLRSRPRIRLIQGDGEGSGHVRGRLVSLDGGVAPMRPLPDRDALSGVLLGALADLLAGRITPTAAGAIRAAAEEALLRLEQAEADPHRAPSFVRAVRALEELLPAAGGWGAPGSF